MSVVLITGCSTGIGLATATHLAAQGHRVWASARRPEAAPQLMELMASDPAPLAAIALDVTDNASVARAVELVLDQEGRIDGLVNNAGVGGSGVAEEFDARDALQIMDTNYVGAMRMARAVLPAMRRKRSGVIVNITSVAGRVALAGFGPYTASKFALEGASECMAQEMAPFGVRVAVIEPGVILTPIFGKGGAEPDPESPYRSVHRRLGTFFEKQLSSPTLPDRVAATVEQALTSESGQFRYRVGADADALIAGRQSVTDEQWVSLGAIVEDEEFFDESERLYGVDLFR